MACQKIVKAAFYNFPTPGFTCLNCCQNTKSSVYSPRKLRKPENIYIEK